MFEAIQRVVVRPFVERWLATSSQSWKALSVPTGPLTVRAPGPDPDRILLIGSGIAMGYGMKTHELALGGGLARQLSTLTGRGTRVDINTHENMTTDYLLDHVDARRLREVDAIVLTPGGFEALLLYPAAAWRREIDRGFRELARRSPASTRVFIVGLPPVTTLVSLPPLMGLLARFTSHQLNEQLHQACEANPIATFIPFAPTEPVGTTGTGRTYERWSAIIAPPIAAFLGTQPQRVPKD